MCLHLVDSDLIFSSSKNRLADKPPNSLAAEMSWGGKRHSKKPFVDVGILTRELAMHADILKDLKGYESASRASAPDAHGLLSILPLIGSLIKLSPTGEIHGKSMRNALTQLLVEKPEINNSQFNGKVWVSLRSERLTTILTHIRELAREEVALNRTAMVLTKTDFLQLKSLVEKVQLAHPQVVAVQQKEPQTPPIEDAKEPIRVLKQQDSNCSNLSVDSDGFPKMLSSPCKKDSTNEHSMPPSFLRRNGSRVTIQREPASSSSWNNATSSNSLKEALGYSEAEGKPKTKLNSASLAKGVASTVNKASLSTKPPSLTKDQAGNSVRKPWLKLSKTVGKNPPRAYILGSHDQASKGRLIVEVTEQRSAQYLQIVDHIMASLKAEHLTKNEALELRTELCSKHI